jgi:hypothetical protein
MKKDHAVNLQCSFCGKSQREVRKLIAGPTVYICDECIGLCNDIIAAEIERSQGAKGTDGRALLRFRVQRLKRETAWLSECLREFGAAFPETVRRRISGVAAATEHLASAEQVWDSAPHPGIPAWLGHPLRSITEIEELLDGLRRAVESSVPPERMVAFYGCLGRLSKLREELEAVAPGESPAPDGGR